MCPLVYISEGFKWQKSNDSIYMLVSAGADVYFKYLSELADSTPALFQNQIIKARLIEMMDVPTGLKVQAARTIKKCVSAHVCGKSIYTTLLKLPIPKLVVDYLQLNWL